MSSPRCLAPRPAPMRGSQGLRDDPRTRPSRERLAGGGLGHGLGTETLQASIRRRPVRRSRGRRGPASPPPRNRVRATGSLGLGPGHGRRVQVSGAVTVDGDAQLPIVQMEVVETVRDESCNASRRNAISSTGRLQAIPTVGSGELRTGTWGLPRWIARGASGARPRHARPAPSPEGSVQQPDSSG